MFERIKLITKYIWHNFDICLTIMLAVVVGVLGIIGIVKLEIIISTVLMTLGLLASSLLANRRGMDNFKERFNETTEIILKHVTNQVSLDELFKSRDKLPSFEDQIRGAKKSIDIVGMSLLTVATEHIRTLQAKETQLCHIRLLLLNPENESLMNMIFPFVSSYKAVETHTSAISTSLNFLKDKFLNSSFVKVGLYDYPLTHGLLIIDRDLPEAKLRVEMYMGIEMPADAPGFYIYKQDNIKSFELFLTEFEKQWEIANKTPFS